MVVIANPEPLLNQVSDHWTSPDARLVARLDRPEFYDDRKGCPLLLGQLRRGPLRHASSQPVDMVGVVPLQPAVDGATCDTRFDGERRHFPPGDIGTDGAPAPPLSEVVLELRLENEVVELLQLHATAPRATDCLPRVGSSHDRHTMILSGSFVNRRGSQPGRSCLVRSKEVVAPNVATPDGRETALLGVVRKMLQPATTIVNADPLEIPSLRHDRILLPLGPTAAW